ncbi:hypothetical protein ABVK25_005141 [Lepraria finkii]|uniref:Ig-like domain-containing protein n=1 Tax=Lepraria finkii TaxID=1340010 RepID=A0ABR4BAE9_9LECA
MPLPSSSVHTIQLIPRSTTSNKSTSSPTSNLASPTLTTALAFLMLGTSSDSDTTYNWLRGQAPCTGTPLNPIYSIQFTVPGGGANFDYQGYNNHVPYNLPA